MPWDRDVAPQHNDLHDTDVEFDEGTRGVFVDGGLLDEDTARITVATAAPLGAGMRDIIPRAGRASATTGARVIRSRDPASV